MNVRAQTCTAFDGDRRIASGDLRRVAGAVKAVIDRDRQAAVLIFDDATSGLVEIDLRGTLEDVLSRIPTPCDDAMVPDAEPPPRGRGRPKLGVTAREVTLLPRHWDWLNSQPGGASVALRKLVEQARRANESMDRMRQARDAAYRFMSAMAGDRPGYEEAIRALFADDPARLAALIQAWPCDIRDHVTKLASTAA